MVQLNSLYLAFVLVAPAVAAPGMCSSLPSAAYNISSSLVAEHF